MVYGLWKSPTDSCAHAKDLNENTLGSHHVRKRQIQMGKNLSLGPISVANCQLLILTLLCYLSNLKNLVKGFSYSLPGVGPGADV